MAQKPLRPSPRKRLEKEPTPVPFKERHPKICHTTHQDLDVFNSLTVGIAVLTPALQFLHANQAFCSLTGYSEESLRGLNWTSMMPPQDWPGFYRQLDSVTTGRDRMCLMDVRYLRSDGEMLWAHTKVSLLSDRKGQRENVLLECQRMTHLPKLGSATSSILQAIVLNLADWELLQKTSLQGTTEGGEEALLEEILHAAKTLTGSDLAHLQRLPFERGEKSELQLISAIGLAAETADVSQWVNHTTGGMCREVFRIKKRLVVEDVASCPFLDPSALAALHSAGIRTVQMTPLLSRSGQVLGMFAIYWRHPHRLTEWEGGLCELLARQMADLLERIQAETGRRVSEERFRKLFFLAGSGIAITDLNGRIQQCNPVFCTLLGYTEEELYDIDFPTLMHPDDWEANREAIHRLKNQECPFVELEHRYLHKHGHSIFVRKFISILPNLGGPPQLIIFALDITDRKKTEDQLRRLKDQLQVKVKQRTRKLMASQDRLRALASQLTLTEERERRKLAHDLHDYLAQMLVVGGMKLDQIKHATSFPSEAEQAVHDLEQILQQALTYTRTTIADLTPPGLQEIGLFSALEWLAEVMHKHGLHVEVQTLSKEIPLAEETAIWLFQSVRELLFNVLKHARAEHATIRFTTDHTDQLCLSVEDGGTGMDVDAILQKQKPGHLGLFAIQERMKALGGRMDIMSHPGQGTQVQLVLPLPGIRKSKNVG